MLNIGDIVKTPNGDKAKVIKYEQGGGHLAECYIIEFEDGLKLYMHESVLTRIHTEIKNIKYEIKQLF